MQTSVAGEAQALPSQEPNRFVAALACSDNVVGAQSVPRSAAFSAGGLQRGDLLPGQPSAVASVHPGTQREGMGDHGTSTPLPTQRKPSFPVSADLRGYLRRYKRERELPITYERLRAFHEVIPLTDEAGKPTLWDTVIYEASEMSELNDALKEVYAWLKVDGDLSVVRHLYVDRVDFCTFGNSTPFRVRIVNAYNDNQDYFYVKKADASRIYGIELEHLLSPNRLNFLTHGTTLIEEHIAGIPGDMFIANWLGRRPELKPIRVAKELVKFNERCFVRLLGDMRSYNFVFVLTPDFEEAQVRIRAMDFDQQSYDGRLRFYLPGSFKENRPFAQLCAKHINAASAAQYRREEQSLIHRRHLAAPDRVKDLLAAMRSNPLTSSEKAKELADGLAEYHRDPAFRQHTDMAGLIGESLARLDRVLRS